MPKRPHDALVASGRLAAAALAAARATASRTGASVEHVLQVEHGLSLEELGASLAAHFRTDFASYRDGVGPLFDALGKLGVDACKQLRCVPVGWEGAKIVVWMADPADLPARDQIAARLGAPLAVKVAVWEDIFRVLTGGAFEPADPGPAVVDVPDVALAEPSDSVALDEQLILSALRRKSDELRLNPREDPPVALRMQGLWMSLGFPETLVPNLVRRFKVRAGLDPTQPTRPAEGRYDLPLVKGRVTVHVATRPLGDGLEAAEIRLSLA